jgi:YVTN family beta-propeller protein
MDTEAGLTFDKSREGQRAADQLRAYLEGKLTQARRGEFTGRVIRAIAHDETLSEAERVANLGVVIFAGFETTTGLLAKGTETLLRHPAQWAYLRDALVPQSPVTVDGSLIPDLEWRWLAWASMQAERNVDPARRDRLVALTKRSPDAAERADAIRCQEEVLDRAVEELLRWTAPGTVVPLTASKDLSVSLESAMTIKGCPHAPGDSLTFKRGDTIAVAVDELNRRCPVGAGRFDGGDSSVLDVSRTENTGHLSFGLRHSCIGAFLAKENAKRAFEGTLRRFPDLELNGVPVPQEMELFSGLSSLPVLSRLMRRTIVAGAVALASGCGAGSAVRSGGAPAVAGTVVVSNMNDNTATILDARTLATLATVPTGRAPHEVAISHDGRWALVSNYGTREAPGNTITVIDIDARAVTRTIELSETRRPHGMVFLPGDSVVAVTAEMNRMVLLIDVRTGNTLRSLPTNGRAPHIVSSSSDGRRLVAGNIGDGTIAMLSPLSNDTARTVRVGRQPEGVAITPDGTRAWAGSNQDSVVVVVDLSRGQPIDTIHGFGLPYRIAVSPNGKTAVVTDPVKATVRVFDEPTRRQRWSISIPPDSLVPTAEVKGSSSPEGVTVSRDSRWAYVTLQGRNRVIAIDLDRGTIVGWGVTGVWSDGIAFSPRSR